MHHLTPQAARKLTDREITKILGGAIGGVAKAGVPPEEARTVLVALSIFLRRGGALEGCPDAPWVAVLSGVVGGLAEFCRRPDVINAIDWIVEHWSDMLTLLSAGG